MNSDPIADYLTRIRNAIMAKHKVVSIPSSRLKKEITKILKEQGYIFDYKFCLLYTSPSPRDRQKSRMPCSG
mgnify:CR=1 FL=1